MDQKTRKFTKRRSDAVLIFAGGVIAYVLGWMPDSPLAESALTWGFVTILGVLGLYQGVGHADLRAMKGKPE